MGIDNFNFKHSSSWDILKCKVRHIKWDYRVLVSVVVLVAFNATSRTEFKILSWLWLSSIDPCLMSTKFRIVLFF